MIDADQLVSELYLPDQPGALAVGRLFGDEVLTVEGGVDHRRLAARVFDDPESRRRLETAIHPLVGEHFAQLAATHDGVLVLEATLLVEAGLAGDFDLVVAVEADADVRLARAIDRGMSESDARARLAAQNDDAYRRRAADITIENSGDRQALRREVHRLLGEIDRLSAARLSEAGPNG